MWVVVAALWAGPPKFLGRKELWGEQRLLSGAIPHPLLDTLQVEEAATLDTAPHLRVEGNREYGGEERREREEERKGRWKEREGGDRHKGKGNRRKGKDTDRRGRGNGTRKRVKKGGRGGGGDERK